MDSKRSRVAIESDDESQEERMATMKKLKTTHEAHISDWIAQQESGTGLKVASTGTVTALLGQDFYDLPNMERRASVGEMVKFSQIDSTYSEIRKQGPGSEHGSDAEHGCHSVQVLGSEQESGPDMNITDTESALDLHHSLSYEGQELSYDEHEAVICLLLLSKETSTQAEIQEQGSRSHQEYDSELEVGSDIRGSNTLSMLEFPEFEHDGGNTWGNEESEDERQAAFAMLQLSRESATVLEVARQESFGFRVANTGVAPSLPSQSRHRHQLVGESGRSGDGEDYHPASHLRQHSTVGLNVNNNTVSVDTYSIDDAISDDATIPDEDAISSDDENYVRIPV
ncbi:hypothetical protein BDZ45DRAFT_740294 [Acephala macrosclerotiorum]|nr:hypothetical protein BDZ45DRAFT_740294 [Acephala macrosclerotiorum]